MRKHRFCAFLSLLLAAMMVCSVLPAAAFAEGGLEPAGLVEQPSGEQPPVEPVKEPQPAGQQSPDEQPVQQPVEEPPAAGTPGVQDAAADKTYTVTYTDGVGGAAFPDQTHGSLTLDDQTPAFNGTPTYPGHKFEAWDPAWSKTVGGDATSIIYTAIWSALPTPPEKPAKDAVVDLLKAGQIRVRCNNDARVHTEIISKEYTLESGSVTVGDVSSDGAGGYVCNVTIAPEAYIDQFDGATGKAHTGASAVSISLSWRNERWNAPLSGDFLATFEVSCGSGIEVQPDLSGLGVTVVCGNTSASHDHKTKEYSLIEGYYDYTLRSNETGAYICTLKIDPLKYLEKYSSDTGVTHYLTDPTQARITVQLMNSGNGWELVEGDPTVNVMCETTIQKPTDEQLKLLFKDAVTVRCATVMVNHPEQKYGLIDDTYTCTFTSGGADGYSCSVEIKAAEYLKKYNSDTNVEHSLFNDGQRLKIVYLAYGDNGWKIAESDLPILVECAPPAPGEEIIKELFSQGVKVHCVTEGANHQDETYRPLLDDSYTMTPVTRVDGSLTCNITISAEKYVAEYNKKYTGVTHSLSGDTGSRTFTLRNDGTDLGWYVAGEDMPSICFNVACPPKAPGIADMDFAVQIYCGAKSASHKAEQFYLVPGTYDFNNDIISDGAGGYTCTVTVRAASYVEMYGVLHGKHALDDADAKTVTLHYDSANKTWDAGQSSPVAFKVVCLYTVTYTDGVQGKAFADQTYTGQRSGASTPKFKGVPTRSGYYFARWSPKVASTVTGDVTYTATWTSASGKLDNVPKTGDGLTLPLGALLLFSLCGTAACAVSLRRRGEKQ